MLKNFQNMSKKSEYKLKNEQFLQALSQEEGIGKLPKGILYKVNKEGDPNRKHPGPRSIVCVHYKGSLINGKVFDQTDRKQCPAAFRLYEVINGWQIALSCMRPGDCWTIYIPAEMGYGPRSIDGIPGNSTLIFEVELMSIA